MAEQTETLVQEAEALGLDVDGRWSDETLQKKIDAKRAEIDQENKDDPDASAKAAIAGLETESGAAGADPVELAADDAGSVVDGSASELPVEPTDAAGEPDTGNPDSAGSGGVSGLTEGDDVETEGTATDAAAAIGGSGEVKVADAGANPAGETTGDAGASDIGSGNDGVDGGDGPAADGAGSGVDQAVASARATALDAAYRAATPAMAAARFSAEAVYGWLTADEDDDPADPVADGKFLGKNAVDRTIAVVFVAVPFVRTNPDAPAEALFITMRDEAPALGLSGNWIDLPPANRIAWTLFMVNLLLIDRLLAAERIYAEAVADAERPRYQVDDDEKTLEPVDDPFALTDVAKAAAKREDFPF